MPIYLLDDTLSVDIFYEQIDCEFDDCICVSILEDCPSDEKIFRAGETNVFLTREQARLLAQALLAAADENCRGSENPPG